MKKKYVAPQVDIFAIATNACLMATSLDVYFGEGVAGKDDEVLVPEFSILLDSGE